MSAKHVELAEIGQVSIYKRRNARSIKITILPKGGVRVTIPAWLPYRTGLEYAKSKRAWILQHAKPQVQLLNNKRIGKYHRLIFTPSSKTSSVTVRISDSEVKVSFPVDMSPGSPTVQAKALEGCDRALRQEAEQLLPQRLQQLAIKHDYSFSSVSIRKLKSRWGSCNQKHQISLNLYLMLLPWPLIDYVLVHELNHTKHLNHSASFWAEIEAKLPNAKASRRELRQHQPSL